MEMFISAKILLTPEHTLVPRQEVRVKSGAFTEASGIILDRRSQSRLLVQVDFLQAWGSGENQLIC